MGAKWRAVTALAAVLLFFCTCVTCETTTAPTPQSCANGTYLVGATCTACGNCQSQPCNKATGACTACEPGYNFTADAKCNVACPGGRFGTNCVGTCSVNCNPTRICDKGTGKCTSCQPGWRGDQCTAACGSGTYGAGCKGQCGNCKGGAPCHTVTGNCPSGCEPGYDPVDPKCKTECPNNKWGEGCGNTCSTNCQPASPRLCDKAVGTCPCKPGFKPSLCTESCDDGQHGQNCSRSCSPHCTDVCQKADGFCTCQPGYQTGVCTAKCQSGQYGQDCSESCGLCFGGRGLCDHVTGNCSRCDDNREMPLCKDCIAGQWGPTCGQRCGQCGGDGSCHPVNGHCVSTDCQDGWTSPSCDLECSDGWYGSGCKQPCGRCRNNSPCRHDNGMCEQDCEDGYTGVLCKTEKDNLVGPFVGSVMGAAVLISLVIVIAVCYIKRRSAHKPETPKKDFMEAGGVENAAFGHELVSARDSSVYQNVGTSVGSGNNYDRTNFAGQDTTHFYSAMHSSGATPSDQDTHPYQNTRVGSSPGGNLGKRNKGGPEEPEATYGNVTGPAPPENAYGNVESGGHRIYGNVTP